MMMMVEDRSYICDHFVNIVYAKTERKKNCVAFISLGEALSNQRNGNEN